MRSAALPAFITPTATASPLSKLSQALTLAAITSLATPTPPPISAPAPAVASRPSLRSTRAVTPAFSISLPRAATKTPLQQEEELARRKNLDEALQVFQERFVDQKKINWDRLRKRLEARACNSVADQQRTLQWLFSHADDPFTRYLSAAQLETMKNNIDGEMCGVGIVFNTEAQGWRRAKRVTIQSVVHKSPASDAGLQTGDEITAIDMVNISRMSIDEVMERLLGKEGRKVLLSFRRGSDGVEINVHLTRRRFEVPTVWGDLLYAPGVGTIGYIRVQEFAAKTAAQTRSAVRTLRRMRAPNALFVLDMRGNSGGLVDKAVEVAKVFLERDHIVVRFVGRDGAMTTERCGWRVWWQVRARVTEEPVVILVDGETASAAELVAASLRDNCRAVVVGNSTFGKGSVQAIVPLSDGAGVAVTVARYRTPNDEGIVMGRGLRPDLFRSNLPDNAEELVKQLFGRGGRRRYRWIMSKIGQCNSPRYESMGSNAELQRIIGNRCRIER